MGNEHRGSPNHEWLRRMAAAEDQHPHFSVGGLAAEAGFLQGEGGPEGEELITTQVAEWTAARAIFARFLNLTRRMRKLSLESLAERADVDLSELVEIIDEHAQPSPRTVYQLSGVLELPSEKLMELAGLIQPREEMTQAAVRFAARSEPMVELSKNERLALEEFVKVLVETGDAG